LRSQRRLLLEAFKPLRLLTPKSRKPHSFRQCEYDLRISDHIIFLRRNYPTMGKTKLLVFIDRFCSLNGIKPVSEATIGRIIKKLKENNLLIEYKQVKLMALDGSTGKLHVVKKRVSKIDKIRKPKDEQAKAIGDIVQFDTVTIQVNRKNTYFINAIDVASRKITLNYSLCS
jgi:hypothetical protein